MRILVLGGDGYLGWPTALHLSDHGHDVAIADNFVRRQYEHELGVESLVPIDPLRSRVETWHAYSGQSVEVFLVDLTQADTTYAMIRKFRPHAIVHFAEQRAAPYSMIDRQHAVYTQYNNVIGTLNLLYAIKEIDPSIHLVKLGTLGEYGTPNIDIEEGWLELTHKGRSDRVLFPKQPGSYYHLSKVHDSHNIEFACRVWGLAATDLNQGIVYGQQTAQTGLDPRLATRLDYDAVFGTVLNRFVIQAVLGEPLTVYGSGSQTRGIIEIRDTVECLRLAVQHPAQPGEYRVFNQLTETMSVAELAKTVASTYPTEPEIAFVDNPRVEAEAHHYAVTHRGLLDLGLEPHTLSRTLLESMFGIVESHQHRVDRTALQPLVNWRRPANPVRAATIPVEHPVPATP
jgi:UDP-sulfoquinovose synthase